MITFTGVIYPTAVMGALGLVFGALLAFASIKFFVETDERITRIRAILPGANCAGCGYPGCDGYAEGIVNDGAKTNLCPVGDADLSKNIANIMGIEGDAASGPVRAFFKCGGTREASPRKVTYIGIADCISAAILPGGSPNACPFGCIGFGSCAKVCVFGALSMADDLPHIDPNRCTGCGTCAAICPKSVLELVPKESCVQVVCNSKWRGPEVKKV